MTKPIVSNIDDMKQAGIDLHKNVDVYRNLHTGLWSIRQGGKVYAHSDRLELRSAEFRVQQAGRKRVIEEQRKNVHAYVTGLIVKPDLMVDYLLYAWHPVSYNPYKHNHFVIKVSASCDRKINYSSSLLFIGSEVIVPSLSSYISHETLPCA
jgi:hypothetical protein